MIASLSRRITKHASRWRQLLLALLVFALPFALLPLVRSQPPEAVWERVTTYPGDSLVRRVLVSQNASGPALYVVGASAGLEMSLDRGASWVRVVQGLPRGMLDELSILDIALDPQDTRVAYAVVASPEAAPRPMLYWTADGGLTWAPRANLGRERLRALAFVPGSDDPLVASSNDILRSVYTGQGTARPPTPQERFQRGGDDLRWQSLYALDGRTEVTALLVSQRPLTATAAMTHTLFVGTRGKGLRVVAAGGEELAPASADVEGDYLLRKATIYALGVHPRHAQRLVAGGDRGLYLSADAGASWRAVGGALRDKTVLSLAFDPEREELLYAGLAGGGVWVSADGGSTWQPLSYGLGRSTVRALAVEGEVLYAGTDNGLWRLLLSPP